MDITVIICTHNRCRSLSKALETVAASTLDGSAAWEVLVVDNNSSDQTRGVVEDFCRRYPGRFRYLFEPQPGKSYALNAGIREARGDVLAFMDDDVTVESTWLQNLTAPLHHGEWAGAGGRILPEQDFSPPRWLALDGPYGMGGILAFFDLGPIPAQLTSPPIGTNMSFRKIMFEKHGGFRTDMGPRPGSEIRNEDTEFGRRLLAAGERFWYEPSAVVYHHVPANRLRKEYFLTFWFDQARALIREIGRRPDIWGIPRWYWSTLKTLIVLAPSKALGWMFALNPQRRFYNKCWVWKIAGEIVESHRLASGKQGQDADLQHNDTRCDART